LGIDFATFSRSIVLGADTTQNFISSNANQRREIIEQLLGLEAFDQYAEYTKWTRKYRQAQIQSLEVTLSSALQQQEHSMERLKGVEENVMRAKVKHQVTLKQIQVETEKLNQEIQKQQL
jgi:DNA repair exonuclease SbcCD ATPase subunit